MAFTFSNVVRSVLDDYGSTESMPACMLNYVNGWLKGLQQSFLSVICNTNLEGFLCRLVLSVAEAEPAEC